jgi:hypothetical protein
MHANDTINAAEVRKTIDLCHRLAESLEELARSACDARDIHGVVQLVHERNRIETLGRKLNQRYFS